MKLSGNELAAQIRASVKQRVANLPSPLTLAVMLVGDDPASKLYVSIKGRACEEVGIIFKLATFSAQTSETILLDRITQWNNDPSVTGILVQLPLPSQNADRIISAIDPKKDVDGFHPLNLAALEAGKPCLIPATALGIMKLINATKQPLQKKEALVISSSIFARPIIALLNEQGANGHSLQSTNEYLIESMKLADIVVTAVGSPGLVRAEYLQPHAIVIDVGTTRVNEHTIGDVDPAVIETHAGWVTPVPGGVGPMTVAMLLENVLKAHDLQKQMA